ncbi:MAG TPA: hypothetical protein VFU85_04340 [Nocardioides sp.]|nr:hypothetical protein [Nocardioides sp.]
MSEGEIGNKPEPHTQPPEHFPGGADAIVDDDGKYGDNGRDGDTTGTPATRDLQPEDNPAVEDAMPEEIAEGDDKQQEPDDETGENEDQPTEPPA